MIPLVAAAVAIFCAALAACVSRGWHAPSAWAIVALYVSALGAGIALTHVRAVREAKPRDFHDAVITRTVSVQMLVIASVVAAIEAAIGSALLVLILDEWTSLQMASIVGALWIGGVVFHPFFFHRLLESEVEVGLDAVMLERTWREDRFVWLCDLEAATVSDRTLVLRRRDGGFVHLPLVDTAIAKRLAELVTARVADVDIPAELAQGGRELAEWRAALTSRDYRTRALGVDEAERIFRSGRAKRDERIGAALVLADLGASDRMVRARYSFTHPSMRNCIDKIVEGTLDDSWVRWTCDRD